MHSKTLAAYDDRHGHLLASHYIWCTHLLMCAVSSWQWQGAADLILYLLQQSYQSVLCACRMLMCAARS